MIVRGRHYGTMNGLSEYGRPKYMPDIAQTEPQTTPMTEEAFLDGLAGLPATLDALCAGLVRQRDAAADAERAAAWAGLLQDALIENKDEAGLLRVLRLRAEGGEPNAALRDEAAAALRAGFKSRLGPGFLKHCGLSDGIPLPESLRRLDTLLRLQPGTLCMDKTWGFGVVRRADDFYEKFTIDFEDRPGHAMTFAYAAEALDILPEDHILARRYREPDETARRVREEPAAIVRAMVRSFGPLPVQRLRELLDTHGLVPEADWKGFWDAARRELKHDPLAVIPAQRTRPIEILAARKAYDADWFKALAAQRHPAQILEAIAEFEEAEAAGTPDDAARAVLQDRLAYCAHAAARQDMVLGARTLLTAARFGLLDAIGAEALCASLEAPDGFLVAAEGLNAREMKAFLSFVHARKAGGTTDLFETLAPRASLALLSDWIGLLDERDCGDTVRAVFDGALRDGSVSEPMVVWCVRNWARLMDWGAVKPPDMLGMALDVLGRNCAGIALRAQNTLRAIVADKTWLAEAAGGLSAPERADLIRRVDGTRGWDVGERRSVMAALIRLYPELEAALSGEAEKREARYTSWRSYRERSALLRELVEDLIPKNSREIAVARSYGDLSENHEYKAAKEHQGILLKRRGEMERDLEAVQGTDFDGFPADRAGAGTLVDIRYADGRTRTVAVLGEWDRDETLDIISSRSRLAEALTGRAAGEDVELDDGAGGRERLRIDAVRPLSDPVKAWIAGRDG
jgi:transcription elongation GreA/GreB family factor